MFKRQSQQKLSNFVICWTVFEASSTNSVDPDQTAPVWAVWSRSIMSANLCSRWQNQTTFSDASFAGTENVIWFLGTVVSPFPNFNNSVLTTRRNLLLHCWTHQYVTINPNFSAYVLQSIRLNGWFRGRVVNSWFWISYFLRSRLIWIYIVFKTGHYQAAW